MNILLDTHALLWCDRADAQLSANAKRAIEDMPFHHRDPFDRVMIAQALVAQMRIVSNETLFDQYGVQRLW